MRPAFIRLHIAIFLWGFTGILGRLISLNEGWLVWWRMLITVVSLWTIFFFLKKIQKLCYHDFLKIAFIGTIHAVHWLFFYGSIKYANVAIALTCLATTALMAAVIEPLLLRKKIDAGEVMLGTLALAGITVIYFSNLHFSVGIYLGLLSAFAIVIVSVLNKKIVSGYTPYTITLYQFTGGFVGLCALMPLYNVILRSNVQYPRPLDWLWLIILALFCTVFTFLLYISALKKLSAFTINLTSALEPVYGVGLAFVIFHENQSLNKFFYMGFALILLAVLLQIVRILKQQRTKIMISD